MGTLKARVGSPERMMCSLSLVWCSSGRTWAAVRRHCGRRVGSRPTECLSPQHWVMPMANEVDTHSRPRDTARKGAGNCQGVGGSTRPSRAGPGEQCTPGAGTRPCQHPRCRVAAPRPLRTSGETTGDFMLRSGRRPSPRRHLCVKPVLLGRREDPGSRPHGDIWPLPRGWRICRSWTGRAPYLWLESRGMPSVAGGRPQSWLCGPAGSSRWPRTRSGVARVGAGGEGGLRPWSCSRLPSVLSRDPGLGRSRLRSDVAGRGRWGYTQTCPQPTCADTAFTHTCVHTPRTHARVNSTRSWPEPARLRGGRGPPPGG